MEPGQDLHFGPFRLETSRQQFWRESERLALPPRALAVLRYLAERPGQIVTKDELLKTVWTGVYVTKAVVKTHLREIRRVLGDDAAAPQYIETVGREGYRFLGASESGTAVRQRPTPIVGREAELTRLRAALQRAMGGERQMVFVTGEPGIGKTTAIDRFRAQLEPNNTLTIGYGQCIEQYGGGEAYLPILEATGRLCRAAGGQDIVATLRHYAPTWLVQLSGVLDEAEAQALRLQVQGATQQHMLREIAEALEAGTARRPLVLIVEDLHWSDQATVELLAYLAHRRERARLLIIGTYRPADLVLGNHPLKAMKQELQAKRLCEEVRLELLSEQAVRAYLDQRFLHHQFPSELAAVIRHRTEGNALFMVNVVEECLQQGLLVEEHERWLLKGDIAQVSIPDTLRQLIEKQLGLLGEDEQRVLEAASVAGSEFAVSAIAAALRDDADTVEEVCEELARRGQFLEERGVAEWPDGTISGKYRFGHALYQNVLYDRIAQARRIRAHREIGERIETGYGEHAKEIAAELALHFEQGHDTQRAVQYLHHAGENALRRNAHREAIAHVTKGLELLQTLPDTPRRSQQELMMQITLGALLQNTKGYAAPEVEKVYTRARELCRHMGETFRLFPVIRGLIGFYIVRGEHHTARELGEQLLQIAQGAQDSALLLEAHHVLGQILYFLGELVPAREHIEQGIVLYDPQRHHSHTFLYGHDPGVACRGYAAFVLWYLGYPDQAVQESHKALTLAQELSHPYSRAYVQLVTARLHQFRQEGHATQEQAEALISLSAKQGFALFSTMGTILRGWALVRQERTEEGITQIYQGLTAFGATGAAYTRAHFLAFLAEAHGRIGQWEEALSVMAEALALVDKTGERYYEAELYRLRGELTLQRSKAQGSQFKAKGPQFTIRTPHSEAEECFRKAIAIAQKQQAKSLELRAATSLARFWQEQGKTKQAHKVLSEVYNWFTEGFDSKDLQEAKALLEDLL